MRKRYSISQPYKNHSWHQRAHCLNMAQRVYLITNRRMTQQCGYPTRITYELHEGINRTYFVVGWAASECFMASERGVWMQAVNVGSALWHRIAVVLAIT